MIANSESSIKALVTIEGPDTEYHLVPSDVLMRVVGGIQDVALILGAAREDLHYEKRFRPSSELKKRHQILLGIPQAGSYCLPLYPALIGQEKVSADSGICMDLSDVYSTFAAIESRNFDGLKLLVPDSRFRGKLLKALEEWLPKAWETWQMKFEYKDRSPTLLDSSAHKQVKAWFSASVERRPDEILTIKGDLLRIDFEENKVLVRYPPTSREITCIYLPDIEDSILESRKDLIEVTGRFVLDDEGNPAKLTEVTRIQPVDLSPIEATVFNLEGRSLTSRTPLVFVPELDAETKQRYVIKNDILNVDVYADTREALMDALVEQLFFLWDTYGSDAIMESDLTEGALNLKRELSLRFKENG